MNSGDFIHKLTEPKRNETFADKRALIYPWVMAYMALWDSVIAVSTPTIWGVVLAVLTIIAALFTHAYFTVSVS